MTKVGVELGSQVRHVDFKAEPALEVLTLEWKQVKLDIKKTSQ